MERFILYKRRQRRLTYPIPFVDSEPTFPVARVKQDEPKIIMVEMKVRDATIPRATNVTSCIQKPPASEKFEL